MPPRVADQPAGTLTREAARRRSIHVLKIAEAIAAYGAGQLADGLGPEQARRTALDAATGLEQIAGQLRKLTRPRRIDNPAGRRALVAELAAAGWSQRRIAEAVGKHKRTVWNDLHHGLATNVPHPGRVSTSPSAASGARAFRTVRVATPNSWASVVVDGIRVPAG